MPAPRLDRLARPRRAPRGLDRARWLPRAALLASLACASDETEILPPPGSDGPPPDACAAGTSSSIGRESAALTVVDRSLIGSPARYSADATLPTREHELVTSQRARRAAAWEIAARVVAPVELDERLGPEGTRALRLWQTWHNSDDLTRIFRRLYPELTPEEQASRAPFELAAIDAASAWNDTAVDDFEQWTDERLAAYRSAVDSAAKQAGIGGIYRVAYGPATSHHVLESYADLLACRESDERVEAAPDVERTGCDAPSFEPACLEGQFPADSVLVKASWQRLDAGTTLSAYDTSAEALARKLAPDGRVNWGDGDRPAAPGGDEMFTLELPNGNRFGLTGLHIMTKELEHWVWITLWWSDRPDEDFGADRPAGFPAPFEHYKLCSVVAFAEGDPDPAGGADDASLASALRATHAGVGGPTWCSNPYIERGDGNASTNCVGCHQHAGTRLDSENILADRDAFPDFSRPELRESFPADYVFSVRTGDDLGAMLVETEEHYASP
ncbi:MAG TPA: hypothetical protein VMG12_04075 [Polyangiaceae bacterium]|nr:hypothetical protein [Polyangiaceae bacterium]